MAQRQFDEARTARALATMHMAGWDGLVACHDSKYVYWVPRPTQADPQITLAIGVPNHPSYPSNHACLSGAIGRVLDASLAAGIHYQMDLDAGFDIARKVATRALEVGVPKDKPFVPMGR